MQRWLTLCALTMTCSSLWVTGTLAQRVVVVQENDTVWRLAKRYHVLPQDIVKANGLKNPDSLKPGSRLRIPAAVKLVTAPVTMRKTGVIDADRVCIRYAPNRTDRSVTLLDKGHPVLVTARKGNWLQVKLPTGQTGWVRDDLVKVTGTLAAKPSAVTTKKVTPNPVARRRHNGQSASKVAVQRNALPRNPQRTRVSTSSSGESIVRVASRFRGVRYRWGGSSRSGFDCSGFTRYVFRQKTGIELPHSASAQFRKGTPVPRHALKPGDLVFFQTYRRGASHVGIYIGDGKFIHASSAGGRVQIDSLNEGYYRQRYLGARRLTK